MVFDSWYSGKENLKAVRDCGWTVPDPGAVQPAGEPGPHGQPADPGVRHRGHGDGRPSGGFGLVKAFRIVATNGDTEHWITNDLAMDEVTRSGVRRAGVGDRGVPPGSEAVHCGVERCQVRCTRAQRNHIGCAIRAFVRLEWHRFTTGVSWFEAKFRIIRDAVRAYLANPRLTLPKTRNCVTPK